MPTATLTSKGQITMPQAVRQSLGLQAGDKVDFLPDEGGGFKIVAVRKDVKLLRGRFAGRVPKPVTVAEMADAVQSEAAQRLRRSTRRSARAGRRAK